VFVGYHWIENRQARNDIYDEDRSHLWNEVGARHRGYGGVGEEILSSTLREGGGTQSPEKRGERKQRVSVINSG